MLYLTTLGAINCMGQSTRFCFFPREGHFEHICSKSKPIYEINIFVKMFESITVYNGRFKRQSFSQTSQKSAKKKSPKFIRDV